MRASIFAIDLAVAGKVDFVMKTNPFGKPDEPRSDDVARDVAKTLRSIGKRVKRDRKS